MEFRIDRQRFLQALSLAQTVVERRPSMPILSHVRLDAEEGQLVCTSTDTMLSLVQRTDAEVGEPGTVVLGAKHLYDLVRTFADGPVDVRSLDNGWARITSGSSEVKLMGLLPEDFPEVPVADKASLVAVPAHELSALVAGTLFSVSTDDARPNLNAGLLESDGRTMTMVTTDGHRLARYRRKIKGPKFPQGILIPRKGLLEMRRVLEPLEGDVEIGVRKDHLFLRTPAWTLTIRLTNARFPAYEAVIPKAHTRRIVADRDLLLGALRQAAVLAPQQNATVRLHVEGDALEITADNPELGQSRRVIDVEFSGDPLTAGFNANYLIDALEAADTEQVALELTGELDPCVVRPIDGPDYLAVVMPMRL
ncbi:MAG: DNA polymerase III subunit beta [Deltaproteobacteria bacterium]|nr:MAG: DNA polymerase III subunit beta [Deltaproteobacteria bacterium]